MSKVDLVAGARPNVMKLAAVYRAISDAGILEPRIIYTGQHYDINMSEVFFGDLGGAHHSLGMLLAAQGRDDEACSSLLSAAPVDPGDV